MTEAPTPTENSKKQNDNTKTQPKLPLHNDCGPTKKVSWSDYSHPFGVVEGHMQRGKIFSKFVKITF